MMTRKHFEAFAEIARVAVSRIEQDSTPAEIREFFVTETAEYCASQNPNFDRARFLAACEPKSRGVNCPNFPHTDYCDRCGK